MLAFFGGISAYRSDFFSTLLLRMLSPTSALAYPTSTVIDETRITGDVIKPQGAKLTLVAECYGVIPDQGRLLLRAEGGSWETLPLLKQTGGVFSYEFVSLLQSFDYYVRLGDDRSDTYHVEVVPPPKVVEKRIRLTRTRPPSGVTCTAAATYSLTACRWSSVGILRR